MIIYPAIDLRGGKVVRLQAGDPDRETVFGDDPVAAAQTWIDGGAAWLHIVNLDGALTAAHHNWQILERVTELGAQVQFGGGLRTWRDMQAAFEHGARRVVIGTLAVQQPAIVARAIEEQGAAAICVALDARNGKVTTHGWQQLSEYTPVEFGKKFAQQGLKHALYTDVSRDGGLRGVNVAATVELARQTGLAVIASGGVHSLDDVRRLAASGAVAGVVIGMALYTGQFTLQEALAAAGAC